MNKWGLLISAANWVTPQSLEKQILESLSWLHVDMLKTISKCLVGSGETEGDFCEAETILCFIKPKSMRLELSWWSPFGLALWDPSSVYCSVYNCFSLLSYWILRRKENKRRIASRFLSITISAICRRSSSCPFPNQDICLWKSSLSPLFHIQIHC